MKGFVKFLKNVLWTFVLLGILGIVGGICYGFYDYYNGNVEKYQRLYTQAVLWLSNMKNKITGEEMVAVTLTEVSPSELPVMTLDLKGTDWDFIDRENANVVYDEENRKVIFVYGKDIGGDLYFPYGIGSGERIHAASLYSGNKENLQDITEYVSWNRISGVGVVSQDLLMELEPGEYYIFIEPEDEQGEICGFHGVPLIVEEETTYISTQQGFAGTDILNGFIVSNLQNCQPIVLPFYNLGDDRIIMVMELFTTATMKTISTPLGAEDYDITPAGNAVILSESYLSSRYANQNLQFQVLLSSGRKLDMGYIRMLTIDGEPDWLVLSGPKVYDQSEGGDLVLDYHRGWAEWFVAAGYYCEGNLLLEESPPNMGGDIGLLEEENDRMVIPESTMKSFASNKNYDFFICYGYPGTGYINAFCSVEVIP